MATQSKRLKTVVEPTRNVIEVIVGDPVITRYVSYIRYENTVKVYVDGCVTSLVEHLAELVKQYGSTYTDLRLVGKNDCDCYGSCNCGPNYYLYGKRLETDLEFQFRLEKEAKAKTQREAQERKEFERLRKKFAKEK